MVRRSQYAASFLIGAVILFSLVTMSGCSGGLRPAGDIPEPSMAAEETTQTSVFYSTGRSLLQEHKLVDASAVYENTLTELLLATPEENAEVAVVQPVAGFNSVTFDDGVITIDWKPEILDFEADPSEKRLALAAVLATFGQFPEVERVMFTVDGETSGDIDGKSIHDFWVDVSLKGQPWAVLRVGKGPSDSAESSGSVEATGTE